MAVNNYIGWATNVNRIILDSATITLGDNATKADELENGQKRTRLRSSFCPDKYQITMDFDWVNRDENGLTEIQRFYEWYKFKHKYGSIPFEFPKIIYSHETGVASESYGTRVEWYKITSAVEGKKYGDCQRVTMTWETVFGGVISIESELTVMENIVPSESFIDVEFGSIGDTAPVSQDFSLQIDGKDTELSGYYFDGTKSRLYIEKQSVSYTASVTYDGVTKTSRWTK